MATQENSSSSTTPAQFTRWGLGMEDDPRLALIVDNPDASKPPLEWRDLDVRVLPDRQDLLSRMGDRMRNRLLGEASRAKTLCAGVPLVRETVSGPDVKYVWIPISGAANSQREMSAAEIDAMQLTGRFL